MHAGNNKGTVLIVDDNITNLKVASEHLKIDGFEVLIARDGETGLERASLAQPDLILLDVQMSGIDGFETCRRLKAAPPTRNIPVIFMTVLSNVETSSKALRRAGWIMCLNLFRWRNCWRGSIPM